MLIAFILGAFASRPVVSYGVPHTYQKCAVGACGLLEGNQQPGDACVVVVAGAAVALAAQ
jgi:biotin transporter BioY